MLDKFWDSIGSDLAKRWLDYILGPAFLFWAGGLGLYVWKTGWQNVLNRVQVITPFQQGSLLVIALLIVAFSTILMQAIQFPLLRLLEGYWPWPFSYLGKGIIAVRRQSFQRKYKELRTLKSQESKEELGDRQREKLIQLDLWAHWHPSKGRDLLPTGLGNILRARERSPEVRYGLDAMVCWPRMWSLFPENVRENLANARSSLDRLVALWYWGLFFMLWTIWTPWAIGISLLWMIAAYSTALQSAMVYGDLIESAFDIHRFLLYDALKWPRPANNEEEKVQGARLTEFLWRGTSPELVVFESRKKE